jgi:hypothetical protein
MLQLAFAFVGSPLLFSALLGTRHMAHLNQRPRRRRRYSGYMKFVGCLCAAIAWKLGTIGAPPPAPARLASLHDRISDGITLLGSPVRS